MKAIIPAAGIGQRLRPHTLSRPKVMLNVAGKPILAHIVDDLIRVGIRDISIIVGYQKQAVTDYFDKYRDIAFRYPEQKEMLGLGHAVLQGLENTDEPALILLGDTIFRTDLASFRDLPRHTLAVTPVDDPKRFGIVDTDDSGRILDMIEKPEDPPGNLAIAGLYYIREQGLLYEAVNRLIRDEIRTRGEYQLTDALKLMLDDGEIFEARTIEGWHDCGTRETLLSTSAALLGKENSVHGEVTDSLLVPPVYIGSGAKVSRCVLGPNVSIAEGSVITDSSAENCIIYENSQVSSVTLKNTIIGEQARISGPVTEGDLGDHTHWGN